MLCTAVLDRCPVRGDPIAHANMLRAQAESKVDYEHALRVQAETNRSGADEHNRALVAENKTLRATLATSRPRLSKITNSGDRSTYTKELRLFLQRYDPADRADLCALALRSGHDRCHDVGMI